MGFVSARRLQRQPIHFAEAAEFVRCNHRHNPPPVSWKFGTAVNDGEKVVGVIMVGRPVARAFDDGYTAEITRCCTDGTKNACSMLYGAAIQAARALGYRRLITYTLASEPGVSLRAAGFQTVWEVKPRSWHTPSRPRVDKHAIEQRQLWEVAI
jgi:hypothetical protein